MEQNFNQPQISLPNASAVLVLGILSIPACCCYGIGVIPSIIALVLANQASKLYLEDPGRYIASSYSNLNTGKICAWIGLIISILTIVLCIVYFLLIFTNPTFQEQMQEIMNQYQK